MFRGFREAQDFSIARDDPRKSTFRLSQALGPVFVFTLEYREDMLRHAQNKEMCPGVRRYRCFPMRFRLRVSL
jgi:hypothetical protein